MANESLRFPHRVHRRHPYHDTALEGPSVEMGACHRQHGTFERWLRRKDGKVPYWRLYDKDP